MAALEETARRELEAQLGKNVPLPQLPKPRKPGLRPIRTSHELRDEGNAMGHCVGSYVQSCLQGTSYIYHAGKKAPAGATLEVCVIDGRAKMMQIRGYQNAQAPKGLYEKALECVESIPIGGR